MRTDRAEVEKQQAGLEAVDSRSSNYVAIARILRPQGRKGEVMAESLTDYASRFSGLREVLLETPGQEPLSVELENAWLHKGGVVLKFAGTESISEAERLKGRLVFVRREQRIEVPAGTYYLSDLTGCEVVIERNGVRERLGKVTEIEPTGGVDLLRVRTGEEEVLIPLAQSICKLIDPEAKLIVIDPPEDLLEINKR